MAAIGPGSPSRRTHPATDGETHTPLSGSVDAIRERVLPHSGAASSSKAELAGRVSREPPASARATAAVAAATPQVLFSIDMDPSDAIAFIDANAKNPRHGPRLIRPDDTAQLADVEAVYKVRPTAREEAFQAAVLKTLQTRWGAIFPAEKVARLTTQFLALTERIDREGVSVLGDVVSKAKFMDFIEKYTALMDAHGNKTWLHSFCDLRRHPEFLYDSSHNTSFFHPLLLLLVASHMGGPVRLNDARAKDTGMLRIATLDSMCHIDNVPYTKEVKIVHFWETGKARAPEGQCFVCLPGTHKTPRASDGMLVEGRPMPQEGGALGAKPGDTLYTTEAGSVFRTAEEVEGALAAQQAVLGCKTPQIVALRGGEKVFTGIAETGAMVHHRWRVDGGTPRSCLLLSFHRIQDDPGLLIGRDTLTEVRESIDGSALAGYVLGGFPDDPSIQEEQFLKAIDEDAATLSADLLDALGAGEEGSPEEIASDALALHPDEVDAWRASTLTDPGTTAKKDAAHIVSIDTMYGADEYLSRIRQLMTFDKVGVLELPLYSDGREEKRKWARNQIRELRYEDGAAAASAGDRPPSMDSRLESWHEVLTESGVQEADLLPKEELATLGREVESIAEAFIETGVEVTDELRPRLAREAVLPSVHQLLGDLSMAIENCSNPECFLSTGLFLFWTTDTLMRVTPETSETVRLREIGSQFLKHYIALNAAIERVKTAEAAAVLSPAPSD